MRITKIYSVKKPCELRAKLKINGEIKTIWCGKSLPFLSPQAWVSGIYRVDDQPRVEITHESGVLSLPFVEKK